MADTPVADSRWWRDRRVWFAAAGVAAVVVVVAALATRSTPAMSRLDLPEFEPRQGGTIWALGHDCRGQLGDGPVDGDLASDDDTCSGQTKLAQVAGIDDAVSVQAWDRSVFALGGDGTVWAWGDNSEGRLGDGTTDDRDAPVRVPGLSQVVDLSVGDDRTYAVKADGTVWEWPVSPTDTRPTQIPDYTGIVAVPHGIEHYSSFQALRADGTVVGTCWRPERPSVMRDVTDAVQISSFYHGGLALRADGTVWVWDDDCAASVSRASPLDGLASAVQVAGSFVLTSDGTVYEVDWSPEDGDHASAIPGLTDVVAISGDLAVRSDGSVWTLRDRGSVSMVAGLPAATQACEGFGAVFVIEGDDSPGRGTIPPGPALTPMPGALVKVDRFSSDEPFALDPMGVDDATALVGGIGTQLALRADGTVAGWGLTSYGLLGEQYVRPDPAAKQQTPVTVEGLSDIVAIPVVGTSSAYAVDAEGHVWGWGNRAAVGDGRGRVGQDQSHPVQVPGLDHIVTVAYSIGLGPHALRADGTVVTWETSWKNDEVQVSPIPGMTDVVDLAGFGGLAYAVRSDGSVWTWGRSGRDTEPEPVQVPELTGAARILNKNANSLSDETCFVAAVDGTVWAVGMLGDQFVVAQMSTLSHLVRVVDNTSSYLAVREDGTLWMFEWAWSRDADGNQVGVEQRSASLVTASLPPVVDVMDCGSNLCLITN